MNRIDLKFKELRLRKKKAFIAFITAGDPDLKTTEELVLAFEKVGVDIVEIGVPFSDPLADGRTIQASSQRALKNHVNLDNILEAVKRIRQKSSIPIALMTYYNPVFHYNESKFIVKAKACGVDGLIIPDLPPEEASHLIVCAKQNDLATIFFISPTTKPHRLQSIVKASSGFIYYVSLTGVTGAQSELPDTLHQQIKFIKRFTDKPICVGFGVSTPTQVKAVAVVADGVIVGSAIVNVIAQQTNKQDLVKQVSSFVRKLTRNLN